MDKLVYQGGAVLTKAQVQPIFWGSSWTDSANSQAANALVSDLTVLFAGPYMLGLQQYSGIGPATILPPVYDPWTDPPASMSVAELGTYIETLLTAGRVADIDDNNQILYFVITNGSALSDVADALGIHKLATTRQGRRFHFAWTSYAWSLTASHEIVEACTDADGDGWFQGMIEAVDICQKTPGYYGDCEGVMAGLYWSNKDSDCIRPRRVAKIDAHTAPADGCIIGPTVGSETRFIVSSIDMVPGWIDASNLAPLGPLQYAWKFNTQNAFASSATDGPELVLNWIKGAPTGVLASVTITSQATGAKISGSYTGSINGQIQADMRLGICRFRKTLDGINRRPPFLIDRFGPDPAPILTAREVEELKAYAMSLSSQAEHLSKTFELLQEVDLEE